jgi:hypothetical protein
MSDQRPHKIELQRFPDLDPATLRAWNGKPLEHERQRTAAEILAPLAAREPAHVEIEARFIDAADLLAKPYEPPSFLVTPIIPTAGAIVVLTGDTGSGKTALLLVLSR